MTTPVGSIKVALEIDGSKADEQVTKAVAKAVKPAIAEIEKLNAASKRVDGGGFSQLATEAGKAERAVGDVGRAGRELGDSLNQAVNSKLRPALSKAEGAVDRSASNMRSSLASIDSGVSGISVAAKIKPELDQAESVVSQSVTSMRAELDKVGVGISAAVGGFAAQVGEIGAGAAAAGAAAGAGFVSGFGGPIAALGATAGPIGVALAATAGIGLLAGKVLADSILDGMGQLQEQANVAAKLGLTPEQMRPLGAAASEAYAAGFGESVEGNLDAVRAAVQGGILDPDANAADVEKIVAQLNTVAQVTGEEIPAAVRTAQQAVRTGLADDVTGALDLITAAQQRGLNVSGDLFDTINEYGTQFRKLGLDGADAFGLIQQAVEGGARDTDKAADAIKEFSIRAIDGSKLSTAAYENLGLSAKATTDAFAAGGQSARDTFQLVIDKIAAVEDPTKRAAIQVALFGTQSEDLGNALNNMNLSTAAQEFGDVAGAAQQAADTVGNTAAARWEQAKRSIEVAANSVKMSLAEVAGPAMQQLSTWIIENREGITDFFLGMARAAITAGEFVVKGVAAVAGAVANVGMAVGDILGAARQVDAWLARRTGDTARADELDRQAQAYFGMGEGLMEFAQTAGNFDASGLRAALDDAAAKARDATGETEAFNTELGALPVDGVDVPITVDTAAADTEMGDFFKKYRELAVGVELGDPVGAAVLGGGALGSGVQLPGGGLPTDPAGFTAELLARVPPGTYELPGSPVWDLTLGLADCSSAVEDLVNMMDGRSTAGRELATGWSSLGTAADWFKSRGFLPTDTPMPGTFQVGYNDVHMEATMPDGTAFNWGGPESAASGGTAGAVGAWDPSFTQQFYRPISDVPLGVGNTAGIPLDIPPGGVPVAPIPSDSIFVPVAPTPSATTPTPTPAVPAAPVPTVTVPQQNVAVVPITTPATGDPVQDSLQAQLDTLNNQIRADDASAARTAAAQRVADAQAKSEELRVARDAVLNSTELQTNEDKAKAEQAYTDALNEVTDARNDEAKLLRDQQRDQLQDQLTNRRNQTAKAKPFDYDSLPMGDPQRAAAAALSSLGAKPQDIASILGNPIAGVAAGVAGDAISAATSVPLPGPMGYASTPTAPQSDLNTLVEERNPLALAQAAGIPVPDYTRQGGFDAGAANVQQGQLAPDAQGRIYSDTAALIDRTFTNLDASDKARHDQTMAVLNEVNARLGGEVLGPVLSDGVTSGVQGLTGQDWTAVGQAIGNAAGPIIADRVAAAIRSSGGGGGGGPLAGLPLPGLAEGGGITGGTPGKDSVPALLMPGEFVLTTAEVSRMGGFAGVEAFRSALNRTGKLSYFAAGGAVGNANATVGADLLGVSQIPILGAVVNLLVQVLLKILGVNIEARDTLLGVSDEFRAFRGDYKEFDAAGRLYNDTSGLTDRSSTSEEAAADERIRILKIVIDALVKYIIEKVIVPIAKAVGNALVQAGAGAASAAINTQAPGAGNIVGTLISSAGSAGIEIGAEIASELAQAIITTAVSGIFEALSSNAPGVTTALFGGGLGAQIADPISLLFASIFGGLTTVLGAVGGIFGGGSFDSGGVANGVGFMAKATIAPERVLSPQQTRSFDRLVATLERGMPVGQSKTIINAPFTVNGDEAGARIVHDRLLALTS